MRGGVRLPLRHGTADREHGREQKQSAQEGAYRTGPLIGWNGRGTQAVRFRQMLHAEGLIRGEGNQ